jgi:hypothetical protein
MLSGKATTWMIVAAFAASLVQARGKKERYQDDEGAA